MAPATVISPAVLRDPITKVPAVMTERSEAATVMVPAPPATLMDLAPLTSKETVPEAPALTEPEKETSFAVMEMGELVDEIEVEPALVTLPVPSVVMVTPVVPIAFAFRVIAPFEPDDVCRIKELPETRLEVVIVPLPVRVSIPLVEEMAPDVPIVAEAPVVVMEKLPPTVEVPSVTAPAFVIKAMPGFPVLALRIVAAV